MAQDTNAIVAQLKLTDPSLIGWSMGGGVAQEASKTYHYRQLYLLASVIPTTQQLVYPFKPHGVFKSESDVLNYVFANNLYHYESSQLVSEHQRFIKPELKTLFPNADIIEAQGKAIEAWKNESNNAASFRTSKTPAQFWLAQHDGIINTRLVESLIANYPDKTIHYTDDSGHALAWQAGQEICASIVP
jgi:pimeloyl-ACP methyl ester carboxylesterase